MNTMVNISTFVLNIGTLFYAHVISAQTIVEFVEEPSSGETIKAIYGSVALVPCVVTSNEIPVYVKWFHNDSEVFAFEGNGIIGVRKDRYSFSSGLKKGDFTLQIDRVTRDDNGTFYCIVSFGIGKSSGRGKLQVYIPPDDNYPKCMTLYNGNPKPGDSIRLSCITRGEDPLLHLSWSDADATVVHNEITNNLIKDITLREEDNGMPYTCSAFGLAVNPPKTCTIIPLKVYPTVEFKRTDIDVYEGNSVELECHGVGVPKITEYEWYYDGQFIGQSFERYELSEDKTRLIVSDVTVNDKGKIVVCRVYITSGLASNVSEVIQVREIVTIKPQVPVPPIQEDYSIIAIIGVSLGSVIIILIIVIVHMCYRKKRIMRQLNMNYQESIYEEMDGSRCDAISFDKLSVGSLGLVNPTIRYIDPLSSRPASYIDTRRDSFHSITHPLRNSYTPSRTSSRAGSPHFDRRWSLRSSRSNTPPETPNRTGSPAYLSPKQASESPFFPRRGSFNRSPSPLPVVSQAGIEPPFLRSLQDYIVPDPAVPSKRVMEIKASEGIPLNQLAASTSSDNTGSMPCIMMEKAVEQTYEEMPLTRKVQQWRTPTV